MAGMGRREVLSLVGGAAAWPLAARAQQGAMPVIGLLSPSSPHLFAERLRAFREGLSEAGFVEGRNVAIEYRWADGKYDRLPALAADLVDRKVNLIFAHGPSTPVAKSATTIIPVVIVLGSDPVAVGLVASLNRPGGNLTGVTTLNVEVGAKRLELLHELVPTAAGIGLIVNPANPIGVTEPKDLEVAARILGLQLHVLHASTERDLDTVFAALADLRAGGLVIPTDDFFISKSEQLAALAVRYALPAIFQGRAFAAAGGLMSYGGVLTDAVRLAGVYAGRILKGERPADLPVQRSTKVELIINLKAAKTLGLTVPLPLVGRADEVIE